MKKSDVMTQLRRQKLVAVVRGDTVEEGLGISEACIAGGIKTIEMAYSNNNANEIIKKLATKYQDDEEICIGAGTVLDAPTARMAIMAGANYIVSPSFDRDTAILCNRYGVPYIPGCMTVTEMVRAMEYGSEMVKMFPASVFGPGVIAAIKAPLPQISILATGGVHEGNIKTWFNAGVEVVGVGGEFNALGTKGEFETITEVAKRYVAKVAAIR